MKKWLLLLCLFVALPVCAKADAPDSDSAGPWVKNKRGCRMMVSRRIAQAAYVWKGGCKAGYAEGKGMLLTYEQGRRIEKSRVVYRQGVPEGIYATEYFDNREIARSEIEFRDGKPNGKDTLYLRNGDMVSMIFADGQMTGRMETLSSSGERFEGETLETGELRGKWSYPNGDRYEGTMLHNLRHGDGNWMPKDKPPQAGRFILDEFVDIDDESARTLIPAKLGLELGMTRKQVEALTGKLVESSSSRFRNAYDVERFPSEKLASDRMIIGKRSVCFDDDGKLWRIWAEILLKPDTYFGGAEVMQAYGSFRKWQAMNFRQAEQRELFPHVGEGVEACPQHEKWQKENPESFRQASVTAPLMAPAQRVIFDIGCGAMGFWRSLFRNEAGERFQVSIRDGNLYATPLTYTASVANEEEMFEKMRKDRPEKK